MKPPEVTRRYDDAWNAHKAEALLGLFTRDGPYLMRIRALCIIAVASAVAATAFAGQGNNPPWFPSLQAFEHYDSGRSHVFSRAHFRGSFNGPNTVAVVRSAEGAYPSGYNMSYLKREGGLHPGRQLRRCPGLDWPLRGEGRP
jgi:hypothetical protein